MTVSELKLRALEAYKWIEKPDDDVTGTPRLPSTYAKFRAMMAMISGTELDGQMVINVTPEYLTKFVNNIRLKDGRVPSESTLVTLDGGLSTLFSYAVAWGLILQTSNPTVKSIANRRVIKPTKVTHVPSISDVRIVASILDEQNNYYSSMLWVLFYTGMRAEECLGLKIHAVDFKNHGINVLNAVTVSGGVRSEKAPKTEASTRTILITSQCLPHLLFLVSRAAEKKSEYVFMGSGLPSRIPSEMLKKPSKRAIHAVSYGTWQKALAKAVKKAGAQGVKKFSSHTLRHAAFLQLLRAGYSYSEVASFAGHGSESLVRAAYSGLVPNDLSKDAAEMSRRLEALS